MVQGFTIAERIDELMDSSGQAAKLFHRLRLYWPYFVIAVAGLLQTAGVCWPLHHGFDYGQPAWGLQILAMAAFYRLLQTASGSRQAATYGLVFSTMWLSSTFSWLYIAMHTYGGLASSLAIAAVFALAVALAAYYAIACWLWQHLRGRSALTSAALFALFWTSAELARGSWLTGFGWGAVGYAHTTGPFAAFIPYIGAYGVGAVSVFVSACITQQRAVYWPRIFPFGAALCAAAAVSTLQPWSVPAGSLTVKLLQGNVAQDVKFEAGTGIPHALDWYGNALSQSTEDLVVAPETAIPVLPQELPPPYWRAILERFQSGNTATIFGIPLGNDKEGYTNSVIALAPNLVAWRYDKHHLVPFGEFIPPMFKWFTRLMNIPLGDFNRGSAIQGTFDWQGQRIGANICYEDLYGEELALRFLGPQIAPTLFVNVSNLAWFGDSFATEQHLNISRMRALEFERPFVRATNTGATVIMNHRGEVTAELPRHVEAQLVGQVEGRSGITPFAWWMSRFGLWPYWSVILLGLAAALWNMRRRKPH